MNTPAPATTKSPSHPPSVLSLTHALGTKIWVQIFHQNPIVSQKLLQRSNPKKYRHPLINYSRSPPIYLSLHPNIHLLISFPHHTAQLVATTIHPKQEGARLTEYGQIVQFFATMFSSLECVVLVPYNVQYICNPLLPICFFNLL
jgi:hypothetical protein